MRACVARRSVVRQTAVRNRVTTILRTQQLVDQSQPLAGYMKIMMFETEIPGSNLTVPLAEVSGQEKTLREPVLIL